MIDISIISGEDLLLSKYIYYVGQLSKAAYML